MFCPKYREVLRKFRPGWIRRNLLGIFIALCIIAICELIGAAFDIYSYNNQRNLRDIQEEFHQAQKANREMLDARARIQIIILKAKFRNHSFTFEEQKGICDNWDKSQYQMADNVLCSEVIENGY